MAATDLGRGRSVTVEPCPVEITYFLLAKEFGWTPSQIKEQSSKDMKGLITILSTYNKVKNNEMDRMSGKGSGGIGGFKGGRQTIDITDPRVEKEVEERFGGGR